MKHRFTVVTLSELLAVNRDGEIGCAACAEHARAESLKHEFKNRARRRAVAAAELRNLIEQLGTDPAMPARIPGADRRGWANPQASLVLKDDAALIDEFEHGEVYALEVYRNALDDHLPDFVQQTVLRQFEDLMSEHEQIRFLRSEPPQGGIAVAGVGDHAQQ
jgi:uncharacterized protein (TIGR02284 family)